MAWHEETVLAAPALPSEVEVLRLRHSAAAYVGRMLLLQHAHSGVLVSRRVLLAAMPVSCPRVAGVLAHPVVAMLLLHLPAETHLVLPVAL